MEVVGRRRGPFTTTSTTQRPWESCLRTSAQKFRNIKSGASRKSTTLRSRDLYLGARKVWNDRCRRRIYIPMRYWHGTLLSHNRYLMACKVQSCLRPRRMTPTRHSQDPADILRPLFDSRCITHVGLFTMYYIRKMSKR